MRTSYKGELIGSAKGAEDPLMHRVASFKGCKNKSKLDIGSKLRYRGTLAWMHRWSGNFITLQSC